jgi:hypothetical protein
MKSKIKESILNEVNMNSCYDRVEIGGKEYMPKVLALVAMDEYTDSLRSELAKYKTALEMQEALVNASRSELAAVKMERDEALKKINEMANLPGMENII